MDYTKPNTNKFRDWRTGVALIIMSSARSSIIL